MTASNHFENIDSYIPLAFSSATDFVIAFAVVLFFLVFRYFLSVFPFYFFYWMRGHRPLPFAPGQIRLEIKYSLISSVLFAAAGVLIGYLWRKDLTQIYLRFDQFGYGYLFLSLILVAILHEFYFYWTHRWMHRPSIFKKVHLVHHLSRDTSPWASFSFHPYEAVILAAFLPLIVVLVPLHPVVIITYMVIMTLSAISNHLGVEIWRNQFILRHFISGTHHASHHQRMRGNYGLYFCFMDRLFRTEHVSREK